MHKALRTPRLLFLATCASSFALSIQASDPTGPATLPAASSDVDFRCEIWPVLKKKCVGCHNPKKREGGLDMSSREMMLKGGHSGPAFFPGNVEKSLMIELIEFGEMPPRKQQKPRITEQELKKLRRWIAAGAPAPDPNP